MLVSEGHVAPSAILIYVAYAITGAMVMSGPDLLLWAMSESWGLCLFLLFLAHVTTEFYRNHAL